MKFALLAVAALSFASFAHAHNNLPACRGSGVDRSVDPMNSDDLLFAGITHTRYGRSEDGIRCLTRAKMIAPGYVDVRLALMDAFSRINDRQSGLLEADAIRGLEMNDYYQETYATYYRKLMRIERVVSPRVGLSYIEMPVNQQGGRYRPLQGEAIVQEQTLIKAITLKNDARFSDADILFQRLVELNPESSTVHMFAGLNAAVLPDEVRAVKYLARAHELIGDDADALLGLSRALHAAGRPRHALNVLRGHQDAFKVYGCYQLAEAAIRPLNTLATAKAGKLRGIMNIHVRDGREVELCVKVKPYLD